MADTTVCRRCLGCGQVANSEDAEPWSYWADLPPGSDLAVTMGVVRPVPCPDCGTKPGYVYLASSWKNPLYEGVSAILTAADIDHYDFRNPPNGSGFGWEELGTPVINGEVGQDTYRQMIEHPRAIEGFSADFAAMEKADTFVLVLPCGKSAHLELGWAVGAGKRTAILLEDPIQPELMYRMVDHLSPSVHELLGWLGVED